MEGGQWDKGRRRRESGGQEGRGRGWVEVNIRREGGPECERGSGLDGRRGGGGFYEINEFGEQISRNTK